MYVHLQIECISSSYDVGLTPAQHRPSDLWDRQGYMYVYLAIECISSRYDVGLTPAQHRPSGLWDRVSRNLANKSIYYLRTFGKYAKGYFF